MALDENIGLEVRLGEGERGLNKLLGLLGLKLIVVLLLTILISLTYFGIVVQKDNAENYYKINQDLNGLKTGSIFANENQKDGSKNYRMRENIK
jgi:hypothetical protein